VCLVGRQTDPPHTVYTVADAVRPATPAASLPPSPRPLLICPQTPHHPNHSRLDSALTRGFEIPIHKCGQLLVRLVSLLPLAWHLGVRAMGVANELPGAGPADDMRRRATLLDSGQSQPLSLLECLEAEGRRTDKTGERADS